MSEWAKGDLTSRLESVACAAGELSVTVSKVKKVEGSASLIASRGTTRYLYEYSVELEFSAKDESGSKVCSGSFKYDELTNSATGVQPCEPSLSWKSRPKSEETQRGEAAVASLKQAVLTSFTAFDTEFRSSKRI